jgi:hypothetical protein
MGLGAGLAVGGGAVAIAIGNMPRLIYLMDVHPGVAGWVQAIGSIAAIVASVWSAAWLQDRGHRNAMHNAASTQLAAVCAIAARCVSTLERIDVKAQDGTLTSTAIKQLGDEITADESTVGAIELMTVSSSEVIDLVSRLQEQVRTGRRRLGYAQIALTKRKPPDPKRFESPLKIATAVLAELRQRQD